MRGMATVLVTLTLAGAAQATPTASQKCESAKLKVTGKYAACRLRADGKSVTKAVAADYTKCDAKQLKAWAKLETKFGAACPTTGDQAGIQTDVTELTACLFTDLSGMPAGCDLITCNNNLNTCLSDLSACQPTSPATPLKTGQVTCYTFNGIVIPCAGIGQDGESQRGIVRQYVDNHDGTVTDAKTGLMWEKKDNNNAGGIHDVDNVYIFDLALSVFIEALNNRCADETTNCSLGGNTACSGIGNGMCGFAGHRDWRVPNRFELETLQDLGISNPGINPIFNTGCIPGCKLTDPVPCSCVYSGYTLTSTSYAWQPNYAWSVDFYYGDVTYQSKNFQENVRAVRGGA